MTALDAAGIDLLWHPSLSLASADEAMALFDAIEAGDTPLDIFCLEGSFMRGPDGTGMFHRLAGFGRADDAPDRAPGAQGLARGGCRHLRRLWRHYGGGREHGRGLRPFLRRT